MKFYQHKNLFLLPIFLFISLSISAQSINYDVKQSSVDIISEGTKIHADLYIPAPKKDEHSFPLIVMAHGWGGTADLLKPTALQFAKAGFYVIAFDYRGWGKSDGKIIANQPLPTFKKELRYTAEIREIREVVDPFDQAQDYINVLNWAWKEPLINSTKIGLWGTSFSGGTVIHVASKDKRVRATVSQAASMGWGKNAYMSHNSWYEKGGQRARGQLEYPLPGAKEVGNMKGGIVFEKLAQFNPLEDIKSLDNCSVLFITVEKEELFKNSEHSNLALSYYSGVKKLIEIPRASHYDIYSGSAKDLATKQAIDWFSEHLIK